MIVDSSAVIAILLREPGWESLLERVANADPPPGIGTPTLVETGIVLAARLGMLSAVSPPSPCCASATISLRPTWLSLTFEHRSA